MRAQRHLTNGCYRPCGAGTAFPLLRSSKSAPKPGVIPRRWPNYLVEMKYKKFIIFTAAIFFSACTNENWNSTTMLVDDRRKPCVEELIESSFSSKSMRFEFLPITYQIPSHKNFREVLLIKDKFGDEESLKNVAFTIWNRCLPNRKGTVKPSSSGVPGREVDKFLASDRVSYISFNEKTLEIEVYF